MIFGLVLLASLQQTPTFGAEVRFVEVDALVTRDGRVVPGLRAEDFELFDNGVVQAVEVVTGPGAPANVLLLLDLSESVAGERLERLKAATRALLRALAPQDHATLLTFANEIQWRGGPTSDFGSLEGALDRLAAGGLTRLHDAVFTALFLGDRRYGRPVVFAFSDGEDSGSWLLAEQLQKAARGADAVLNAARLALDDADRAYLPDASSEYTGSAGRVRTISPQPQGPRRRPSPLLAELADLTGGRVWAAGDGDALKRAFLAALDETRGRYLLRYEPRGVARGWHELKVRLKVRGELRARRGYQD
ncbi:MAG TPA: VWA domain-containing protein [Vicinamibacteria bacterium]|nr:VWA domain-containing protein [Vicinamibacteria bacterium]